MRNSDDSTTEITGYEIGTEVKFKAGYRIWSTKTGGEIKATAFTQNWLTYKVTDGAVALGVTTLAAASAIASMLFCRGNLISFWNPILRFS